MSGPMGASFSYNIGAQAENLQESKTKKLPVPGLKGKNVAKIWH